ncbi:hypothetical protein [Paenibacillus alba]|uniref:Uncharacterized protein n=1 Tax=Paenibacillus alba TaxID=1197127 RepID=A0ABU6G672_9BACL|nr:hypothetical protein [Paenibacillus alba]MEC0229671.1 hypothetical protein [Paenibacillus alba]
MNILLSEKELLNKLLIDEEYKSPNKNEMVRVIVKYYYGEGFGKKKVSEEVEKIIEKKYGVYNPLEWDRLVNKYVKLFEKTNHNLYSVDEIVITKDELLTIKSINNMEYEKVAFSILVHTKIKNCINPTNNNWMNSKVSDVLKDSKLSLKSHEKNLIFHKLANMGLIEYSNSLKSTDFKVLFINSISQCIC